MHLINSVPVFYFILFYFLLMIVSHQAETRMEEEKKRLEEMNFPDSTRNSISHKIAIIWVSKQANTLIFNETEGCKIMFDNNEVEQLLKVYNFFCKAPDAPQILALIKDVMATSIIQSGKLLRKYNKHVCIYIYICITCPICLMNRICNSFIFFVIIGDRIFKEGLLSQQPKTTVTKSGVAIAEKLVALNCKYENIVSKAFNNCFQECLRTAVDKLINQDFKVARYLASYVDSLVKTQIQQTAGLKQKSDLAVSTSNSRQNFDDQLKDVIRILK